MPRPTTKWAIRAGEIKGRVRPRAGVIAAGQDRRGTIHPYGGRTTARAVPSARSLVIHGLDLADVLIEAGHGVPRKG